MVNIWINSGKPGGVVAEEFGIPANSLYNWRKGFNRQPETPKSNDGVDTNWRLSGDLRHYVGVRKSS